MNPANGWLRQVFRALEWRSRPVLGSANVDKLIIGLAKMWRPRVGPTIFIGVAGSAGKTTTKDLCLGMLSRSMKGDANTGTQNVLPDIAKTVLSARWGHRFCIAELSEHGPGVMDDQLALLQPAIGIVTTIRDDHLSAYGSHQKIANEVAKLVEHLPANGFAILNADDELVVAMAGRTRAQVLTFGTSDRADLRVTNIASAWPARLSFEVTFKGQTAVVQTRLCGTHWVTSAAAAMAVGIAFGKDLEQCAQDLALVDGPTGRMQPVTTPDGVTFIRDDFKAPLWTLDACFDFMREANAKRKIIVIGELSDMGSERKGKEYAKTAVLAQQIADTTIYVGPWASSVLRARDLTKPDGLHVFSRVRDAAAFLKSIGGEGDLVLLKGTLKQDHLQRLVLDRTNAIACWRDDCQRTYFCEQCPERMKPSGRSTSSATSAPPPKVQAFDQVIVGLGNPGAQYANTLHNVGYDAVDQLAADLGFAWVDSPLACMAQGNINDQAVCLLKIATPMNLIGGSLKQLSANLGVEPAQCILVFDDLDLPLGTVKTRQRGSAGGHRGVASILEAFQTDTFRRVKIGVGQAEYKTERTKYVLAPFAEGDQAAVRTSIEKAVTSLRGLINERVARSKL